MAAGICFRCWKRARARADLDRRALQIKFGVSSKPAQFVEELLPVCWVGPNLAAARRGCGADVIHFKIARLWRLWMRTAHARHFFPWNFPLLPKPVLANTGRVKLPINEIDY